MLDTAIWKELGVEEVAESEAFYHAKIPHRQAKTQFLIASNRSLQLSTLPSVQRLCGRARVLSLSTK
jgi:hypothetical protein